MHDILLPLIDRDWCASRMVEAGRVIIVPGPRRINVTAVSAAIWRGAILGRIAPCRRRHSKPVRGVGA